MAEEYFNVEMPDGTIIEDIPVGTSKEVIQQKYNSMKQKNKDVPKNMYSDEETIYSPEGIPLTSAAGPEASQGVKNAANALSIAPSALVQSALTAGSTIPAAAQYLGYKEPAKALQQVRQGIHESYDDPNASWYQNPSWLLSHAGELAGYTAPGPLNSVGRYGMNLTNKAAQAASSKVVGALGTGATAGVQNMMTPVDYTREQLHTSQELPDTTIKDKLIQGALGLGTGAAFHLAEPLVKGAISKTMDFAKKSVNQPVEAAKDVGMGALNAAKATGRTAVDVGIPLTLGSIGTLIGGPVGGVLGTAAGASRYLVRNESKKLAKELLNKMTNVNNLEEALPKNVSVINNAGENIAKQKYAVSNPFPDYSYNLNDPAPSPIKPMPIKPPISNDEQLNLGLSSKYEPRAPDFNLDQESGGFAPKPQVPVETPVEAPKVVETPVEPPKVETPNVEPPKVETPNVEENVLRSQSPANEEVYNELQKRLTANPSDQYLTESYVKNPATKVQLEKFTSGQTREIVAYGPPGTGKSSIAEIAWPEVNGKTGEVINIDRGVTADQLRKIEDDIAINPASKLLINVEEADQLSKSQVAAIRRIVNNDPRAQAVYSTNFPDKLPDEFKNIQDKINVEHNLTDHQRETYALAVAQRYNIDKTPEQIIKNAHGLNNYGEPKTFGDIWADVTEGKWKTTSLFEEDLKLVGVDEAAIKKFDNFANNKSSKNTLIFDRSTYLADKDIQKKISGGSNWLSPTDPRIEQSIKDGVPTTWQVVIESDADAKAYSKLKSSIFQNNFLPTPTKLIVLDKNGKIENAMLRRADVITADDTKLGNLFNVQKKNISNEQGEEMITDKAKKAGIGAAIALAATIGGNANAKSTHIEYDKDQNKLMMFSPNGKAPHQKYDKILLEQARNDKSLDKNTFNVISHGGPHSVDGSTPQQLAQRIKPYYTKGQNIRLEACKSAAFAKEFSKLFPNVEVSAPTGAIISPTEEPFDRIPVKFNNFSMNTPEQNKANPDQRGIGKNVTYKNGKEINSSYDLMTYTGPTPASLVNDATTTITNTIKDTKPYRDLEKSLRKNKV